MDRYMLEAADTMLCREVEDIIRRGISTHKDLDVIKDSFEALYYSNELKKSGEGGMGEYSQRSYGMGNYAQGSSYANYDMNSYARGGQGGRSNAQGGGGQGGNSNASYLMYDPYMMARNRGYSGTGSKEEILQELQQMVKETSDEKVKSAVLDCISKMEQ